MSSSPGRRRDRARRRDREKRTRDNEILRTLEALAAEVRGRRVFSRSRSRSYRPRRFSRPGYHRSSSRDNRRDVRNSSGYSGYTRTSRHRRGDARSSVKSSSSSSAISDGIDQRDTRSSHRYSRSRDTRRDTRSSSRENREQNAEKNSTGQIDNNQNESQGQGKTTLFPSENKENPTTEQTECQIDAATLALLGEVSSTDQFGPKIHSTLVDRWTKILQKGLEKELRQELLKKYPPNENCVMMKAPALNPEVKPALSPHLIKKEFY